MLSSKANAALARLKEIEEKYKRRKEQKWREDADSSISSISIALSENLSGESKEFPKKVGKIKLDIKMPDTRFERHAEEMKLSLKSEKSTDKASTKSFEDAAEVDLDATMSLDDKSSRFAKKQESPISDIMIIQENNSIESVLDDSVTTSKSLSHSKTSRRNDSIASGCEEKTTVRSKREKESDKSSEISRGKATSHNLSIAKRLSLSRKQNEISKARLDLRKHSIEDKTIARTMKNTNFAIQNRSNSSESLHNSSVIEESIRMMENSSEIISELSYSEKNMAKIDDVECSKHLTAENTFASVSTSSKRLITENGYANDTFEDISSSTIRSKSRSQREEIINEKKNVINRVRSNAKKINIKEYQDSAETYRDERIIELDLTLKPNATKVGSKSSNYVSDVENIIAHPDNMTEYSIKLPKSVSSRLRNQRSYQHRKKSFRDENTSSAASSNKNISDSSKSSTGDMTKTNEKKNFSRMTTVQQESNRKEREEASNKMNEYSVIDVIRLPVAADDEDRLKSAKFNSLLKKSEKGNENISEESLDHRILQDAEYVLRKLHKDAINALAKRHANSKSVTEVLESPSGSKTESEIRSASKTRKMTARDENESYYSTEKDRISNCNDCEQNNVRKKKREKIMNIKSAETRNSTRDNEDKALKFDRKQTLRLRKRFVELRLQQEREDLQKYLRELKDSRLESGFTQSYFRPLDFPKIAEFTQPDVSDFDSKPDDQHVVLRERILAIRRWLKDQYVLYRDYCTMAQAINAHYVPTTLEDAKKTIHELRKTTIER
ncbi:restin homolog [Pogonomyrmex barbatus]|uniref:Restin homolog n=1 Tax=Pogonomyrmex barbatus TaxID=144034 RepID=A0A8N1S3V5_9HYME|nr:restin homolog [Pogonomyrmex barbatus]